MEIDAQKRLHGPWHYDEVVDYITSCEQHVKRRQKQFLANLRNVESNLKRCPSSSKPHFMRLRSQTVEQAAQIQHRLEDIQDFRRSIQSSKAILIGPATLDSLVDEEPHSWDYIDHEQLPFEHLFFDFVEPLQGGVPVSNVDGSLIGLSLHAITNERKEDVEFRRSMVLGDLDKNVSFASTPYNYTTFIRSPLSRELINITGYFQAFSVNGETKRRLFLGGEYQLLGQPQCDFIVDPVREETLWTLHREPLVQGQQVKYEYADTKKIPHHETLERLPRLCVNLVNYINAHNVTVVARNRKPRIVKYDGKFIEEPSSRRPFHLITIKDEEVGETREAGKSWELNWRVFVRGHPVRYRDEQGNIYLTIWRRPHLRGPENAPWREQRYEVLAKKLEQEREMYRQH